MAKTDFEPKVSIIIPVYNGSNYVAEAINSALAQTYKNIEIIVVNDGSRDDGATEKIAHSYGEKIRYFTKENGGVATALNLGIEKMTGEYFSWLSHDDMYYPKKIEKQINFLRGQRNRKVVLYSNFSTLEGEKIKPVILDHKMLVKKKKYSLLRGCVNGVTVLVPKVIFDDIGNFKPELKYTQDYDCWMRMQEKYPLLHMEDILSITRFHSGQESKSKSIVPECNRLWIDMIEDLDDTEKLEYEGSKYGFYYEMAEFLRSTPYGGALKYCEDKLSAIKNRIYEAKNLDAISSEVMGYINVHVEAHNEKISTLESDLAFYKNRMAELDIENKNLANTLENIRNSKRFKIIDKLANIKNRILK